jgi:hypothetical protein
MHRSAQHRPSMRPRITQVSLWGAWQLTMDAAERSRRLPYPSTLGPVLPTCSTGPIGCPGSGPAHDCQRLSLRRDGSGVMCVATQ